ncbi:hypothetical protein Dsin_013699 [Dipteronia sinensis]|uniref:Major facilitator superfamily (MFS) profile domain-containing protein n=1 Tax=Dipteronia sinensis TaxID=43782 RepID=A0AAE0E9C5_9ROSI|nr:hypothetical protein Dsin_013699 [Dipteronia sinensis]
MGRERLEEGLLLPRSSLEEPSSLRPVFNGIDDEIGGDSSATPVVVFCTLVAIYGSFCTSCGVNTTSTQWRMVMRLHRAATPDIHHLLSAESGIMEDLGLSVSASGYSSPAESGIMEDLGLSVAAYSVFGSVITAGGVLGSLVNGKIAELLDRRCAMWLSELFCIVGWLDALSLDIGRFSLGIGVGIIAYVVPVYITEITPKNIRGAFTAANKLLLACGFSLMYFLGTVVSWRPLAMISNLNLFFDSFAYIESIFGNFLIISFDLIFQLWFHVYCKLLVYSSFQSLRDGWQRSVERVKNYFTKAYE